MSDPSKRQIPARVFRANGRAKPSNYQMVLTNELGSDAIACNVVILTDVFNMDLDEAFGHAFCAAVSGHAAIFESSYEVVETKAVKAEQRRRQLLSHQPEAAGVDIVVVKLG